MGGKICFFRFRLEDSKGEVTFFEVAAFSARQARLMLHLGLRATHKTIIDKRVSSWRIPRPKEAKGVINDRAFVMHEGKILKFS